MAGTKSSSATSSSTKRKRLSPAYYAVKYGHKPDVYLSWDDVQDQIRGFENPVYRKFTSLSDAEAFLKSDTKTPVKSKPSKVKYYAVQVGWKPDVYTDWKAAERQVTGYPKAKHKSFSTEEEAWAFVNAGKGDVPAEMSAATSAAASTLGDVESELSISEARKGCKVGSNASKKKKKNDGSAAITASQGDFELGTGPLPPDAEDGFDRSIVLNKDTGKIERKTDDQLNARIQQPTSELIDPLIINTDGAAPGNGKEGGVAGIGIYFGPNDPRNVSDPLLPEGEKKATNQRAELAAIQRAVDLAPIDRNVIIRCDSYYAINCVTDWFKQWREKQWKNAAGKDVVNRDIIEAIINRIDERKLAKGDTRFEWVKGHANDPGNSAADALAVNGARRAAAIQRRLQEEERRRKLQEEQMRQEQLRYNVEDVEQDDEWDWIRELEG